MTWQFALGTYAVLLIGCLLGGVGIGAAIGLVGVVGITLAAGSQLWLSFGDIVWNTTNTFTLVSIPRSSAITGEMFSVVWANSQNARTPKMMPNRTRSFPTNRAPSRARDDCVDMVVSFMTMPILGYGSSASARP